MAFCWAGLVPKFLPEVTAAPELRLGVPLEVEQPVSREEEELGEEQRQVRRL